jgi:hypothetical protein
MNSENSYLKLFQIANQNLSLVQKEERANRLVKMNYREKGERHHMTK